MKVQPTNALFLNTVYCEKIWKCESSLTRTVTFGAGGGNPELQ